MTAKLSVVATPIGNLEDITLRALSVLRECDVVLCEDTRVTKKILNHFEIDTSLVSYHSHSGQAKYEKVFEFLREGKHVALVSDAGTPTISDPGAHLVQQVREQFPDVKFEAIPGASALTAALSISGVHADSFTFFGFPPHKKGRETFFNEVSASPKTVVFYESPHRILKALTLLKEKCSSEKKVTVVRELTKIYEEVVKGSPQEVLEYFENNTDKVRGEFVVIIS
jgi:16S rRNA (cytidine1402-2'-O)-methyltransferase